MQILVVADLLPVCAVVIRAIQAALGLVLDQRPDAAGLRRRGGHADLALDAAWAMPGWSLRCSARSRRHRWIATGRYRGRRWRSARSCGRPPRRRRRECAGCWIEREIDRAGLVADEQHLPPVRAAVGRFEDAALACWDRRRGRALPPRQYRDRAGWTRILPMWRVSAQADMRPGAAVVGDL